MKKIILLILIIEFLNSGITNSQTGRLSISQVNNGSTIDVSIYLKRTGSTAWNLGFASLVFNYNYNAMNSPSKIQDGLWDNNLNPQYDDQIIASYGNSSSASIEIGLSSLNTGTEVPADSALAGKIRFNISDPLQMHNITWNVTYSAVLDNSGNDITQNIVFLNPPNSILPVELSSFYSNVISNDVFLHWSTLRELNNMGFDIERKYASGKVWEKTGFIKGSLGSNQTIYYNFADRNLTAGAYNYRLKQIDINGHYEYFYLAGNVEINNPLEFYVSQNYPNPFNPSTIIKYHTSEDVLVKITLYDLTGKEIKTYLNEFQTAGYHELKINAADLLSGVYFYKVRAGIKEDVKSMLLLK